MGSVMNVSPVSYSEESISENWAGEYAKHSIEKHKTAEVLDHLDGSVTFGKLESALQSKITNTEQEIKSVKIAVTNADAKAVAAVSSASGAVQKAEKSLQYWKPNTLYNEGQVVYVLGTLDSGLPCRVFECITTHTSHVDFRSYDDGGIVYWKELGTVRAGHADDAYHADSAAYADLAEYDIEHNEIISTYATKAELTSKAEKDHTHSEYAKVTDVPKKVGELENDSGYLTEHQDVSGKADKATTLAGYGITDAYTKDEIDTKIGDIDTALDDLHAYAQAIVNGGAAE